MIKLLLQVAVATPLLLMAFILVALAIDSVRVYFQRKDMY